LSGYKEKNDNTKQITGKLVAYRGLFLMDKNGIVQHCVINNMPLGRSVDETLRMVDALQYFGKFGKFFCKLASWTKIYETDTEWPERIFKVNLHAIKFFAQLKLHYCFHLKVIYLFCSTRKISY
jgi:hypothetical protein